jgi:hypothetical protein
VVDEDTERQRADQPAEIPECAVDADTAPAQADRREVKICVMSATYRGGE